MSRSELVEAYMFSWIIINLHNQGWSQIYARFMNNYNITTYNDFYNHISDKIIKNELGIWSEQYKSYKAILELYLDNNTEFVKRQLSRTILYDVQQFFHQNAKQVEDTIFNYIKENYTINTNTLKKLKEMQHHYIATYNKTYPYEIDLDFGILETIKHCYNYIPNIATATVDIVEEFLDKEDFLRKILPRRKNGWGKTIINEKGKN
jgi:hypothetical protein